MGSFRSDWQISLASGEKERAISALRKMMDEKLRNIAEGGRERGRRPDEKAA